MKHPDGLKRCLGSKYSAKLCNFCERYISNNDDNEELIEENMSCSIILDRNVYQERCDFFFCKEHWK